MRLTAPIRRKSKFSLRILRCSTVLLLILEPSSAWSTIIYFGRIAKISARISWRYMMPALYLVMPLRRWPFEDMLIFQSASSTRRVFVSAHFNDSSLLVCYLTALSLAIPSSLITKRRRQTSTNKRAYSNSTIILFLISSNKRTLHYVCRSLLPSNPWRE